MSLRIVSLALAGISLLAQSTPSAALAELAAGNLRWVNGRRTRTTCTVRDAALRASLVKGQAPFAVIVTCADSRVDETLVFDQEPGRLFVVREAGNAPDLTSVASIDYAIEHLGAKVVVLLGHTKCGAVTAVAEAEGAPLPGNLWVFQQNMEGLLESTPRRIVQGVPETLESWVSRLIPVHAHREAQELFDVSPVLEHAHSTGKVRVVPAVYDLASGKVTFEAPITPHE